MVLICGYYILHWPANLRVTEAGSRFVEFFAKSPCLTDSCIDDSMQVPHYEERDTSAPSGITSSSEHIDIRSLKSRVLGDSPLPVSFSYGCARNQGS